jgi:alpha-beta hydrolase superfamily lysophospholipase
LRFFLSRPQSREIRRPFDNAPFKRKCPSCVRILSPNAARGASAAPDSHWECCSKVRALTLLIAITVASCAQREAPVVRRLGPALCKEGPPSWETSDGRQLMYRTWGPLHGVPRAVVVGVPGWNGTAGDMAPIGRYLAQRGIRAYSTGVRGQHGDLSAASERTKGHIDDGQLWERDFYEFVEWVQRRHQGTPLFLYGQSMGSLTAMLVLSETNHSRQIKPAGIILHSPAVAMMYASPVLRLGVGRLRSFNPRGLLLNVGLISGEKPALTNSAKFDRHWGLSEDRVRPGFSWAFFDETLKLGARARTAAASMEVPVIVLTGDKDPIGTAGVGQRAFARLMRSIPSREKERQRFLDGYHDLIHDSNRHQAVQSVGDWLDRHLRASDTDLAQFRDQRTALNQGLWTSR